MRWPLRWLKRLHRNIGQYQGSAQRRAASAARTLVRPRMDEMRASGFYGYDVAKVDNTQAEVDALIERTAQEFGIERREIADEEIVERQILSLINVGAQIVDEGVAYRASDIDVIWTNGYGYPRWRGGPMFYADTLGLPHVLERVRVYEERYGDYWKPAPLLVKLAESGSSFAAHDAAAKPG